MTCARCGLPECVDRHECERSMGTCSRCGHSPEFQCLGRYWGANGQLACRDRQIAAQAALLRSVTGKLEELHTILLDDEYGPKSTPVMLIDSVLEVLS